METFKTILQVFGTGALLVVLLWIVCGFIDEFQSWQLKRNRVHDDLNRHEDEIRKQRLSLEIAHNSLKNVWEEIEKLKEDREVVNASAAEEIPEAITISEVPPTDKFFLDCQGDVWKQAGEALSVWDEELEKWAPVSGCQNELFSFYKAVQIPAQHAEALVPKLNS